MLIDAIIEHQTITQLVLALVLVVLQLEVLERFQLLVVQPVLVQPDELGQQRHIRLCHSLSLEHSMAGRPDMAGRPGVNRSSVLQ